MNEPSGWRKAPGGAGKLPSMTDASAQIASKLKALYQALENEPIPQHFIELLERLDAAENAQSRP
ncbi:NepR family anti-sigma factor [Sinorhizobium garamanticum]